MNKIVEIKLLNPTRVSNLKKKYSQVLSNKSTFNLLYAITGKKGKNINCKIQYLRKTVHNIYKLQSKT